MNGVSKLDSAKGRKHNPILVLPILVLKLDNDEHRVLRKLRAFIEPFLTVRSGSSNETENAACQRYAYSTT